MTRPVRLGMVGGGEGAFIGGVHRIAARLDGEFELVAGAFSSTPEKSIRSGKALNIDEKRCYGSFLEMAKAEAAREDGIEAVSIVTPNHMHLPVAEVFMEAGIHVICDKPLTTDLAAARSFLQAQADANVLFILSHNYPGTPMVIQAREMVADGKIGKLRYVQAEYVQDWLTVEADNKQASWRGNPELAGKAGCVGDIGSHAYNLASFIAGENVSSLCADLTAFVKGRAVDDNASILLRYASGAKGMLWASQVAPGNENRLSVRLYGDKGGLEWRQEEPNYLWYTPFGEPTRLITRGGAGAGEAANSASRIPAGHPEGYLEAFAIIYKKAAEAIRSHQSGIMPDPALGLTSLEDGVHGMAFIDACLRSSSEDSCWVEL